ncbi:hypothetical protein J5N97_013515 [Dioscorea zingiberensis]|uniref:Uncharacterized protein n=1 Tax=Dioscorea zingiberensis TaxID=325984 RepID=A0A9D5CQW7_9LILI|nr:hypothetical protein J5N97_013515 [Dioscorea zingiberensis]
MLPSNFLSLYRLQDVSPENKLRLLMIYASISPEKFEGEKGEKLMQLARLSPDDMRAVNNMRHLGGSDIKKTSGGGFSLKFDVHKELIEKLSKGELPQDEYPCMNDPSPIVHGTSTSNGLSMRTNQSQPAHSMRSRRTAIWAKPRNSDDGYSRCRVLYGNGKFNTMCAAAAALSQFEEYRDSERVQEEWEGRIRAGWCNRNYRLVVLSDGAWEEATDQYEDWNITKISKENGLADYLARKARVDGLEVRFKKQEDLPEEGRRLVEQILVKVLH